MRFSLSFVSSFGLACGLEVSVIPEFLFGQPVGSGNWPEHTQPGEHPLFALSSRR